MTNINNNLKLMETILTVTIVFLASFLGNVYAHELGHYVVADMFGLSPKMSFEPANEALNFGVESKELAYTEFNQTQNKDQMFFIALAGPLVNLLLVMIFLLIYINYRHIPIIQNIAIGGLIPSIFSFVVNIIPYASSDGMAIISSIL